MPLIHRRTESVRLRSKIQRLLSVSTDEYIDRSLSDCEGRQEFNMKLTAVVKARLWKLMQRKLFDRLAARRLKSLICTNEPFNQSFGSQTILDDGSSSNPSSESTFQPEDDDLLFEPGKEFFQEGGLLFEDPVHSEEDIWSSKGDTLSMDPLLPQEDNSVFEADSLQMQGEMWREDHLFREENVAMEKGLFEDWLFGEEEEDVGPNLATDEDLFHEVDSKVQNTTDHHNSVLHNYVEKDQNLEAFEEELGQGLNAQVYDDLLDGLDNDNMICQAPKAITIEMLLN